MKAINVWVLLFLFTISYSNINAQVNGRNEGLAKKEELKLPEKGWKKLTTDPYPGKQDDITFINETEGWYVNGYGSIYHTKNGGETWEKQFEKKGTFFRSIAFVDSLVGYINHGKLDNKIHIYAVGRVGSPTNMMASHDGGLTWTSNSMDKDSKMLFDIKMFDKNNGIVCAASDGDLEKSNALILKTSDGGKTWKKVYQSNRPFEGTWKASFPTREVGYVTIQSYNPDPNVKQQRIAKTIDGGETWNEINLVEDAEAREFGIGFIDENHGFVGTMNTGYETKDGGKTWTKVNLGMACNKIRIYKDANGKTYGYAIGVDVLKGEF